MYEYVWSVALYISTWKLIDPSIEPFVESLKLDALNGAMLRALNKFTVFPLYIDDGRVRAHIAHDLISWQRLRLCRFKKSYVTTIIVVD